jgi:hypothetical protein
MSGHGAGAEAVFVAVNITPDFCKVHKRVVPYDIWRDLSHEKQDYASTVHGRGKKLLKIGSVVQGVVGDAGKGIISGVSLHDGNVFAIEGSATIHVEGKPLCRHGDVVLMNVK